MFRSFIIISILCITNVNAFVIWPNVNSPCNASLQSCIDNSPDGEYIEIRTNDIIDETIFTNNPISLVAGNGYKPVFSMGNNISIRTFSTNSQIITVKGLTFLGGYVEYIHGGSADATLYMTNNDIQNGAPPSAIRIQLYSNAELTANVEYNIVSRANSIADGAKTGTIWFNKAALSDGGEINGRVYNNKITAYGEESVGLGIFDVTQGNIDLDINGNEFYGGGWGAITARKEAQTGLMKISAVSNAFYAASDALPFFRGVRINAQSGIVNFYGINNTILGADSAFLLIDSLNSTLTNYLYNNIMAYGNFAVNSNTNDINNDYNLTFQNQFTDSDFIPGVNHIYTKPFVIGMQNGRLRNSSPAIDNGSVIAYSGFFDGAEIDADGLLRVKKGTDIDGNDRIDIGAYEYGDLSFVHRNSAINTHISTINHPELNNLANLDNLHVNSNWNPNSSGGIYNNDNEGLYYSSGFWRVFNQDFTIIEPNSAFNITKFASSENTFEHLASPSNSSSTTINSALINGDSKKILHVTQHWKNVYNNHPFGLLYANNWKIINLDLENIPEGSNFNIYAQDASKSAWVHRTSNANVIDSFTIISHPLLDGVDCAQLLVTQSADFGVFNANPIGVWYTGENWSIFNQNSVDMPINAGFHVVINPEQISECVDLIFKDNFE